ncbi:MAG: hypothetical protein COV29_03725 [Candidatus Yanofskybacteria bacterium CG10_big_fil_rev_8_21_14_0_10_36_16]|uniref:Glucose/Sorbosone dehydrogenase domain-containing protein n=1 Tax=Candidatus Yanofskybacteria bacterium CG10_big_fil_rev_8_21_14_0_10_36_16 TaxID=1975096 RepID=A0A2J0Q6W9_9BACT|nr:MAG: hypothetical protein COV29_03725 [Candidatus Yanofskybacteria bacterium CG10_big_fil_rev_8_21_14_0_10_36_16]
MQSDKKIITITVISALAVSIAGGLLWPKYKGILPAIKPPPKDITKVINSTDFPFILPDGFSIEIFAKDLPGARVMAFDSFGNMWVSQTREGQISLLEIQDGKVVRQNAVLKNLNHPHGLAFDPQNEFSLYYAEEDKISRIGVYSDGQPEKIIDLPGGGRHFTRTINFGPEDNRLYVSIGSSCDVCEEKDKRRGTIYSMNRDGSDFKPYATGLRNAVFFDWSYLDGRMWATEMGRDNLGDDLPPDEINIIEGPQAESKQNPPDFGWPICYGKGIHDTKFDKKTYIRNPCEDTVSSHVDLQAHSAPLGLAFVPEEGWPEEYWYDLLVAYHGSWNRTEPTGYKIARIKLDAFGNYEGTEDFISGWLVPSETEGLVDDGALGRPVDIITQSGGVVYVSDDHAGVIYKIKYLSDWSIRNFEECAAAGYPIMESHPRQCREPGGKTFVEDIGNELEKIDIIRVDSPRPNSYISSPLTITGQARGIWFFEASFPIRLLDENNREIAVAIAQAQSDWMTKEFVPFKATLNFNAPATNKGILVFEKDNPSGLPEYEDKLIMPILFDSQSNSNGCIVTGCSGQVCADEEMITTCEYLPEYACYKTATCERQSNGECEWTMTEELTECLGK